MDEGEGVQARWRGQGGHRADVLATHARGVRQAVEEDGVASEDVVDEDFREDAGPRWVKPQLDLPGQFCADFEQAAVEADGAVFADGAPLAVEEDVVEGLALGQRP